MSYSKIVVRMGVPTLLVIGLSIWVSYALTSPKFALLGAMQACESSDVELFNRYVDVPGVLSRASGGLLEEQKSQPGQAQGLGAALAKGVKAELVAQAVAAVQQKVRQGGFASSPPKDYPWLKRLWLTLVPALPPGVTALTVNDKLATVSLALPLETGQPPLDVSLLMRRQDASWQIIEIQKVSGLLDALGFSGFLPGK